MSFNRTSYDPSAYNLQINRSIGPGDYRLFGSFAENSNQCISVFGPIGSKADVSVVKNNTDLTFENMVDVDSILSWRNHKLSKDNNYIPSKLPVPKINNKNECCNKLSAEDTRFTHPIDNYRCLSLTTYQYEPHIMVNPQCYIQDIYSRNGLNSRLYSKDMYILKEQKFWDKGDAFPKPTNNHVPLNNNNCKLLCNW